MCHTEKKLEGRTEKDLKIWGLRLERDEATHQEMLATTRN